MARKKTEGIRETVVVVRWDKKDKSAVALFPEHPATPAGDLCDCYVRVGGHGCADYHGVIQSTCHANREQRAPIVQELKRIGYHVRVISRATWRHHDARRAMAREIRRIQ